MTPEEWHKIKTVLQTALELPPEARGDFLDSECVGQVSVRSEVESLLRAHEQDQAFLEQPAAVDAEEFAARTAPPARIGQRLGPYKLLEEIGEGGMGAVYRAVRADGLYDKQVAIKLLRSGLSTEFFASRFRDERQILAGLEHPNIARLLDGGVTEEGLPYVVLEFVPGVPIDEYYSRHDLSITERLKLFRTVCSAVQYAHQNLVVHRDLKPGNILVTEDGIPKLLDFGIAKILDPQQEEAGRDRTLTVMRIMTPDFASPEQVRGDSITTATDVYSLGVILYVLLTGQRPYRLSSTSPHEIIKVICDTDPKKPSTAAARFDKGENALKEQALAGAGERTALNSKRQKLGRALKGDLDNIVLKALRKEPERRYATVEQFSEDVRRHLEHLPVIARKDTPGYRASKFVLRHKAGVAAAVVVALTLLVALVITIREERIAQRRFNEVRSLANSLIFEVHDSIRDLPGATAARKLIVERAQQYLDSLAQETKGDPALLRELAGAYARLGNVLGHPNDANVGDTPRAIQNFRKAEELQKLAVSLRPADLDSRRELARIELNFALALGQTANLQESDQKLRQAVQILEPLVASHPGDLKALSLLSDAYSYTGGGLAQHNDLSHALEYYEKSLALCEHLVKSDPQNQQFQAALSFAHKHVGSALSLQNKLPAALEHYRAALAIDEALLALQPDNFQARYNITYTYSDTGYILGKQGDLDAALSHYRKALEIRASLAAADPQNVKPRMGLGNTYAYIGGLLEQKRDFTGALESYKKSLSIRESLLERDPSNDSTRFGLAMSQAEIGNLYATLASGPGISRANQLSLCRNSQSWLSRALPVFSERKKKGLLLGGDFDILAVTVRNLEVCGGVIRHLSSQTSSNSSNP
jgi:non-specific serine/threonine protein kinase/serine/threonine-protein kinase